MLIPHALRWHFNHFTIGSTLTFQVTFDKSTNRSFRDLAPGHIWPSVAHSDAQSQPGPRHRELYLQEVPSFERYHGKSWKITILPWKITKKMMQKYPFLRSIWRTRRTKWVHSAIRTPQEWMAKKQGFWGDPMMDTWMCIPASILG